jgi:hypothetical protein
MEQKGSLKRMATLKFSTGSIAKLDFIPVEEGLPTGVFVLEGKMTYGVAKLLLCEGLLYDEQKKPRAFENSIKLTGKIKDAELALPGKREGAFKLFQCDIPGLTVKHTDNADDNELKLEARCHFSSKHAEALDFIIDKRKADFAWEIRKRQGSLFEVEEEEGEEETDDKQMKIVATEEQKEAVAAAND